MIRATRVLSALAVVGLAAACRDSGTAPPATGGVVSAAVVSLATPNGNDGAMIVMFSGPDVATIQAADSHYVLYSRSSGRESRVIIIGNLVPGALFTVQFGTPHTLSEYAGTVQQVATRGDSILASTAGYQVTIGKTP